MEGINLSWSLDFPALLERCEQAGKGHLRPILHHWHACAVREKVVNPPLLTALVVYGEARGEGPPGPQAVFEVIANRAARNTPPHLDTVLLRPYQFACLGVNDLALSRAESETCVLISWWLRKVQTWIRSYAYCEGVEGLAHATMYARPDACGDMYMRWLTGDKHAWDFNRLRFCRTVGNHSFFQEV